MAVGRPLVGGYTLAVTTVSFAVPGPRNTRRTGSAGHNAEEHMTAHEIQTPWGHAMRRGLALLLIVLTYIGAAAPAALAVEEATPAAGAEAEEERLTFEELQRSSSQRAREFFPDPYEEPSFFQWISIPVLLAGLVIAVALLAAYLWWQPRFAAERRQKERR
jgi:hypothetical protein